jgi:hypothetical protein
MGFKTALFLSGVGSALEICPPAFSYPIGRQFPPLNDAQRLASDWYRVGHALYSAIGRADTESHGVEKQERAQAR